MPDLIRQLFPFGPHFVADLLTTIVLLSILAAVIAGLLGFEGVSLLDWLKWRAAERQIKRGRNA